MYDAYITVRDTGYLLYYLEKPLPTGATGEDTCIYTLDNT